MTDPLVDIAGEVELEERHVMFDDMDTAPEENDTQENASHPFWSKWLVRFFMRQLQADKNSSVSERMQEGHSSFLDPEE